MLFVNVVHCYHPGPNYNRTSQYLAVKKGQEKQGVESPFMYTDLSRHIAATLMSNRARANTKAALLLYSRH